MAKKPEDPKWKATVVRIKEELVNGAIDRPLPVDDVMRLIASTRKIFRRENALAEAVAPISVCGDVHGQLRDLIAIFDQNGWPPMTSYVFLGDYVDRGSQSLEVISLLFAIKADYPKSICLLRGNHETQQVNVSYGFKEELHNRYGVQDGDKIWTAFNEAFAHMPLACLISKRILSMHGGISPRLKSLNDIRSIPKPLPVLTTNELAVDLLCWSDPSEAVKGFKANQRGISCTFGADAVIDACNDLDVELFVRAHQVVQEGYEYFASRHMLTVFSAAKYPNGEGTNKAAWLKIDFDLSCNIRQLGVASADRLSVPVKPRK